MHRSWHEAQVHVYLPTIWVVSVKVRTALLSLPTRTSSIRMVPYVLAGDFPVGGSGGSRRMGTQKAHPPTYLVASGVSVFVFKTYIVS